jgi:hypothetical protein
LLFAVTAVLLLFALSVERADFVQDYADLDDGAVQVVVLEDGLGDMQDNDTYTLPTVPSCCRVFPAAEASSAVKPRAVLAIFGPDPRPPALA